MSGVTPQEPIRAVGIEREDATQKISVITTDGSRLPFTPQQEGYVDLTVPARPLTTLLRDANGEIRQHIIEEAPKDIRIEVNGDQVVCYNTPRTPLPSEELTTEAKAALERERLLYITSFGESEGGNASIDLQTALHDQRRSHR
jgi:hypothetical protein